MLASLPVGMTAALSVVYVMAAQALSGVAKDLTKMSSKSAIKLVVPEGGHGLLFQWVALLTGSKNALKGVGFFVGGYLLYQIGFEGALLSMAGALTLVLVAASISLKSEIGKAKRKIHAQDLFSKSHEINLLSAARIFLFASRDVWFVVGLPVFLTSVLGWSFDEVGSFMALWVIGYGIVQALVPKLLRSIQNKHSAAAATKVWGLALLLTPALIGFGLTTTGQQAFTSIFDGYEASSFLLKGLVVFGVVFAINSALHSYLIVAYADADTVALSVGFYYMANAVGRLLGTLLSGLIYQYYGLAVCLFVSSAMVLVAVFLTFPLGKAVKNTV